jgi:hypothetical protein
MGAEVIPGIFRNHLPLAEPAGSQTLDDIKSIECEVTVVEAQLDSAPGSRSHALIFGFFYNKNTEGGATGDIMALVRIGERGNGGLEASWVVVELLSDDGQQERVLDGGLGTLVGPGTLQYDTPYKLKLSYDGNETFRFSIFVNSTEYVANFTGPQKERPAVTALKSISTGIDAVNGSNNGYVSAKFDNVFINDTTAYDDFESNLIDTAKWNWNEWVREPSDGYLRAGIIGYESTRTVNTYLTEKDAPYLEAKVSIDSGSQLSPGAYGVGRIQGYYYNDSRGPGSGQSYNQYEGDVFVQVRLRYNSEGTLSANAYVDRSDDANQGSFTNLFSHDFPIAIALDTYYTLSIRFEGNKLTFGCNSETAEYNITTPTYPAYGEHRLLRSRAYLGSGQIGYIETHFDDVYIEKKVRFNASIPIMLLSGE